jgi:uncharacterized protein YbdZ (MbtH family)
LTFTLTVGTRIYRFHDCNRNPLFFGRTRQNRFDSPDATFGVLYAGMDEYCAFIETFGQSTGIRVVTRSALQQRCLSYLEAKQPLLLIDLARSGGLARVGADSRLFSGSHSIAQKWSAALRTHPSRPHGILYPARHDAARCACSLFNLPISALEATNTGPLTEPHHSQLLANALNTYDFGFID